MPEEDFGVSHPLCRPASIPRAVPLGPAVGAWAPPNNPRVPRRARGARLGSIATDLPRRLLTQRLHRPFLLHRDCVAIHRQLADVKGAGGLNNLPEDPGCFSNGAGGGCEQPRPEACN